MANFDMRGQRVTNQYNAGRDMNFGAVQTTEDLITAFEQLNEQFTQAKKPDPDKKTIVDHLTTAKTLLEGVTAAGGLVTALTAAIQIVQKLFS